MKIGKNPSLSKQNGGKNSLHKPEPLTFRHMTSPFFYFDHTNSTRLTRHIFSRMDDFAPDSSMFCSSRAGPARHQSLDVELLSQELNAKIERCKFFYPEISVVHNLWSGHVTSSKPDISLPHSINLTGGVQTNAPMLTHHPSRNLLCFSSLLRYFPTNQLTNPKIPTQQKNILFSTTHEVIFHPLIHGLKRRFTPFHCYLAKL